MEVVVNSTNAVLVTRGIPIFIFALLLNFAFADTFTGNAQPVVSPITDCSVAPPDVAENTASAYINSEFTYLACREYRSSKTKVIYYKLESVYDGEYTHMIPAPGKSAIDPMDYRYSVASVYQSCLRIRDLTLQAMVPLQSSKCADQ